MKKFLIISAALLVFTQMSWAEPISVETIAIVPFDNMSDEETDFDFNQVLYDFFKNQERFKVIPQNTLKEFFIEKRIRRIALINRAMVRELGKTLGIDLLMMGSINALSEGDNPVIDVSVHIVDTTNASIIWMKSVTIEGNDFAKFLGIGRIKSIEKLSEIALEKLFKDILLPFKRKKTQNDAMPPFEVVRANFYPKIAMGKSFVDLMVEFREITEKPTKINASIENIKIPLVSNNNKLYTSSFVAPYAEGTYALKLSACGKSGELFSFDSVAQLVVDNTPPAISISSSGSLISPNDDGRNDYVMFFPLLMSTDTLKGWKFEITNEDGEVIRSDEGEGNLPRGLIWRGENNKFKPVGRDGIYFGQLTVQDKAGYEVFTNKLMIKVDRVLSEIKIVLDKVEQNIATFDVTCGDVNDIEAWSISIYDKDNELLETFAGNKNFPSTLQCMVKKKAKTTKTNFPICMKSKMRRETC